MRHPERRSREQIHGFRAPPHLCWPAIVRVSSELELGGSRLEPGRWRCELLAPTEGPPWTLPPPNATQTRNYGLCDVSAPADPESADSQSELIPSRSPGSVCDATLSAPIHVPARDYGTGQKKASIPNLELSLPVSRSYLATCAVTLKCLLRFGTPVRAPSSRPTPPPRGKSEMMPRRTHDDPPETLRFTRQNGGRLACAPRGVNFI